MPFQDINPPPLPDNWAQVKHVCDISLHFNDIFPQKLSHNYAYTMFNIAGKS